MKKLIFLAVLFLFVTSFSLLFAATSWYLPEGSTQGFDLWILVNNPNSTDATVRYIFYWSDGTSTGTVTYPSSGTTTVTASSRSTLHVNTIAAQDAYSDLLNKAISTKVECTNGLNIYAERAMYWPIGDDSDDWTGGHTARGISGTEGCFIEVSQPTSFPVTISTAGSYKLTSNLTCSTEDTNAISITVSNVTLDLNGFTIVGPGNSEGSSGSGISVAGTAIQTNVIIKNGHIRDFRAHGLYTSSWQDIIISDLNIYNNGGYGIYMYQSTTGIIKDCNIYNNGDSEEGGGIYANHALVKDNYVYSNSGYGIYASSNCTVINNTVTSTGNSTEVDPGAGIYIFSGNLIKDNNVANGDTSTADGIYVYSSYNQIIGNNVIDNEYGIYVRTNANSNLIKENLIVDNTDDAIEINGDENCLFENIYNGVYDDNGNFTVAGTDSDDTPDAAKYNQDID